MANTQLTQKITEPRYTLLLSYAAPSCFIQSELYNRVFFQFSLSPDDDTVQGAEEDQAATAEERGSTPRDQDRRLSSDGGAAQRSRDSSRSPKRSDREEIEEEKKEKRKKKEKKLEKKEEEDEEEERKTKRKQRELDKFEAEKKRKEEEREEELKAKRRQRELDNFEAEKKRKEEEFREREEELKLKEEKLAKKEAKMRSWDEQHSANLMLQSQRDEEFRRRVDAEHKLLEEKQKRIQKELEAERLRYYRLNHVQNLWILATLLAYLFNMQFIYSPLKELLHEIEIDSNVVMIGPRRGFLLSYFSNINFLGAYRSQLKYFNINRMKWYTGTRVAASRMQNVIILLILHAAGHCSRTPTVLAYGDHLLTAKPILFCKHAPETRMLTTQVKKVKNSFENSKIPYITSPISGRFNLVRQCL